MNVKRPTDAAAAELQKKTQTTLTFAQLSANFPGRRRTENAARIPGESRTHSRAQASARRRSCQSRAFTCCQYSSRDGRAEKYPVSCTIWSSWKMLHMGMTSISLRGCSHEGEAKCRARRAKQARGVHTGALVSAVRACMRRSAKRLRASAGGFGACNAPRAHNKRTLGKVSAL